jgi:hypothetical protein
MAARYIVVNQYQKFLDCCRQFKPTNIWIPVPYRHRRYGAACNVSQYSQPLVDFCTQHGIAYTLAD